MNLSITLVHNKTDAENIAQIVLLKTFLTQVTEGPYTDPTSGETYTVTRHEIKGLDIPHTVQVFQIVPYGVTPPPNRYEVNSGGIVYYGEGDNDKVGQHPRFFNWSLKRGTDKGADIVLYLEDLSKFNIEKLKTALQPLNDPNDTSEFADKDFGKLGTLKLLKEVGQLREDRNLNSAINELKQRVTQKGLKNV